MENQNDHPVSQDDFNEVIANNGEFSYYGESYTVYREYLADCLETDEVREEYSEEVLKKWRRKVQFEDLFKTYHVYDIIGTNTKKSITLNEYRTMFAKFVSTVFDESGGPETALPAGDVDDEIPDDIASRDTDGTISAFTTMMTRMENSLYSLGVVGTSARDSLIPLVILRLLQDHFESGVIDIMNIEKYPYNKVRVTEESIKYVLLKNYRDLDAASASMLLSNIWQHVLSQHPVTSKIFEPGKYVDIRSDVVLLSIINELVAFDFENCSPDNLSIAYQHFIHRQFKGESGSRMGQHFTPDRLINMMIREYGHLIPTTGKYADPFMGTAGFIMAMYNANKTARASDNPSEYLYGTEIDPNVFKYAFTNLLVQTGQVCDNIKNESAFTNHKDRYSAVFTNPPFGKTISKDEKPKTYKYNLAKVANRNLVCLQYCMHILAPGGICSMVWVNGAECFGSNKSAKEIRKRLFTEFHFLGAIMVPGQKKVFEHAGIKPIVLTFRKPTDDEEDAVTPSLKIYECDEACETIELVMEAEAEKLEEKDYVISVDAYKEREQLVVHEDAEIKTLGEVCDFLPTNKIKTSEGKKSGKYKFYNSSQDAILYTDEPTIDKESIIIGNGGNANVHYDTKFTPSKHVTVCHVKDDTIVSAKFIYYYLRYNIHVLDEISNGAALKWINKTNLSELQIPIPSLERQKEIIERIMEWEESLKVNEEAIKRAESDISRIASRSLSLGSNMEIKTLGEVCEFKKGKSLTKSNIVEGEYPVIGGGKKPTGFHNEYNMKENTTLVSSSGSAGYVSRYDTKCWISDCTAVIPKEEVDNDYLYYVMKYQLQNSIYDLQKGSAQPHVYASDLKDLQIPVPSMERQKEMIELFKNMESRIKTYVDHKKYLEHHRDIILENMSREFQ